tara:strand:- start:628 stop:1014 length:387 start_codon:yes stop_codon:yes gene_type:complete
MLSRLIKLEGDKGFTLIELLIVIAIIGILAAIVIPQFSAYKQRTYNSDTKAILHNLYLSCKAYWADKGKSSACATADISSTTYGFTTSPEMTIAIGAGAEEDFAATAANANVPGVIYSIDSAGTIIKK